MALSETVDRVFDRLLWMPQPREAAPATPTGAETPAARSVGIALMISGLRCTLQYVVLPIVLPLIGVISDLALPLVILLDGVALVMLVRSMRYYWGTRHPRRFDMLPLFILILALIFGSLGYDLWHLLG